jgi:hypothetical protein
MSDSPSAAFLSNEIGAVSSKFGFILAILSYYSQNSSYLRT